MKWFIRGKDTEGFIECDDLNDAFVEYVKEMPLEFLGLILLGHSEYFPKDFIPPEAKAVRTTIPLVKAGILTEDEAMDINEKVCGKRII